MITTLCKLDLAYSGQETLHWDNPLFACAAYRCDIRDYLARQIPPHWHRALELVHLLEGEALVPSTDGSLPLRRGELCFVNADALHGIASVSDGPCPYRTLVFDPSIVAGVPGSVFDMQYVRPLLEDGPRVLVLQREGGWEPVFQAFETAYDACAREPEGYEFLVRGALSQLLLELRTRSVNQRRARPASQQELRIKQMITWMDRHYADPVTVADVAQAASICPRECQRVFSHLLGITPIAYLQRRRATAAAELLASTDLSVTEVGMRCGYGSPSYFAKQFGRVIGCSPHLYRANMCPTKS